MQHRMKLVLIFLSVACSSVHSENLIEAVSGVDVNRTEFFTTHGMRIGGWLSMGATYVTDNPDHHNNAPISFNDRSGEFQLNQVNFFFEKYLDQASQQWDIGGRFDVLFGTDARFTQATGLDEELISEDDLRFYDLAIPQAYLEVFAPIGNGITAKIGHFYTIMGYEVVAAPQNFFYSHAYTMQYGEPFTHTGALFSYALNSNFTVNGGAVLGWDNADENLGNWNFLGGLFWSNDQSTSSVAWTVISGEVDDVSSENRTLSSLVITHNISDRLQYVFQHDFGYQEKAVNNETDAYWYGINQYLFYDLNDTLSLGLRGEWFRDDHNTRLNLGSAGSYYALTAGVNWKPLPWATLRPEVRYDWVDSAADVYDNQSEDHQLAFSMDVVISF